MAKQKQTNKKLLIMLMVDSETATNNGILEQKTKFSIELGMRLVSSCIHGIKHSGALKVYDFGSS